MLQKVIDSGYSLIDNTLWSIKETPKWISGLNNIKNISYILKDTYSYQASSSFMKLKQIGTEVFHIGCKYVVAGSLTDRIFTRVGFFSEPIINTTRYHVQHLSEVAIDYGMHAFKEVTPYLLDFPINNFEYLTAGMEGSALLYLTLNSIGNLGEGIHAIKKYGDIEKGTKNILNAGLLFPAIAAVTTFGMHSSIFALPALYALSKQKNTRLKIVLITGSLFYLTWMFAEGTKLNFALPEKKLQSSGCVPHEKNTNILHCSGKSREGDLNCAPISEGERYCSKDSDYRVIHLKFETYEQYELEKITPVKQLHTK